MATNKLQQLFVLKADDQTGPVLKAVTADFKKMGKNISSVGAGFTKKVTAPIAGVAAGLAYLGKNGLDAADRMQKLSQKTGAAVEFLSQMRGVAELSGVEFEQVAQSIVFMNKSLGESALGIGEAKGALQELGVSLGDLQGMSPEQQFAFLTEQLMGIDDVAKRTALATKILGDSGASISQVAENMGLLNTETLKNYKITTEQANRAATFNDAITILKGSIANFALDLATSLAPALEEVTKKITEGIEWFKNLSDRTKIIIGVIAGIAAAIGPLLNVVGNLITLLPMVATGIRAIIGAFSNLNPWVRAISLAITGLTLVWSLWGDEIKEGVGRSFVWIKNAWKDTRLAFIKGMIIVVKNWKRMVDGLWDLFYPVIELLTKVYTKYIQFILKGVSLFLDKIAGMLEKLPDKLVPDGWVDGLRNASKEVDNFGENLDLTELVNNGKENLDNLTESVINALEEQKAAIEAQPDAIYKKKPNKDEGGDGEAEGSALVEPTAKVEAPKLWKDEDSPAPVTDFLILDDDEVMKDVDNILYGMDRFKQTVGDLGGEIQDNLGDAFSNALFEGENFFDSVGDMLKDLGKQLMKSAFVNILGNIFSGGGVGGLSLLTNVIGGRSGGGKIGAGQSYWVGESGREIFTPSVSGYITPESQIGSTNNITSNINISVAGISIDDPVVLRKVATAIADEQKRISRTYR
jgi:hypothetical protein